MPPTLTCPPIPPPCPHTHAQWDKTDSQTHAHTNAHASRLSFKYSLRLNWWSATLLLLLFILIPIYTVLTSPELIRGKVSASCVGGSRLIPNMSLCHTKDIYGTSKHPCLKLNMDTVVLAFSPLPSLLWIPPALTCQEWLI